MGFISRLPRLKDLTDIVALLTAGNDGKALTWNNSGGTFGMTALSSGTGDMTWAIIQASQLANEVMNWPANVGIDIDLVAANQWWDSVGTPSTAATMVDVAGEAGITETWEYAFKCVADANDEGLMQRYTYADQPRIKSGRKLSAIAAVWVATAGKTVTMKLITSASTEVSATATAQAWTIIKCENLTLDGTYVDLQFTADTDTFYVVPLGVNIGEKAVPLPSRALRYVNAYTATVVNAVDPGAAWTDGDFTASTSNLAAMMHGSMSYTNGARITPAAVRRNGSSAAWDNSTFVVRNISTTAGGSASFSCILDDGQILEFIGSSTAGDTETVTIGVTGWWEWA